VGFSETRWVVKAAVGGALVLALVLAYLTWYTRKRERRAISDARSACAQRIGEAACADHFDRHHRECFNITNDDGSRFRGPSFDARGYLECIVKTPDVWRKERNAERARRPH
jgi:hypothetical protein